MKERALKARRFVLAALAAAPLAALAQAPARRKRVAFVGFDSMFDGPGGLDAVVTALERRGFADGRQIDVVRVRIEVRMGEEKGRGFGYLVPMLERQVPAARPDVIVALGSIMAGGLQHVTKTIPIVTSVADPVAMGLADSLSRPGRNVTGTSGGLEETSVKAMEFMKVLMPSLSRVVIFHDGRPMATRFAAIYERAARSAGLEPAMVPAFKGNDLVRALQALPAHRARAGLLAWKPPEGGEDFYDIAVARRLPLVGASEVDAERGALVSYSAHDPVPFPQRMAAIVEQVLRGGDPAGIPFHYPQGFRLVVNRRTARSLGFTVPAELLLRADRVID